VAVLTSADLRRAFTVAGAWHEARSLPELASIAVETLHDLVRCDAVGWNEVDVGGREVRAVTSPADYFQPGTLDALGRLIEQHPIVSYVARTGDLTASQLSDFVSVKQLHRLELYVDAFRPNGIEEMLAMVVQTGPTMVGLALTRPRRTYRERDRDLLNALSPHLGSAYRNLALRDEADRRALLFERALEGREVVELSASGRPVAASPLLARWFGTSLEAPEPGTYRRGDADLVVRLVPGDPALLLLDERRYAVDPERVRSLGLTPREGEVLALAARGLTDIEIASELFLSPRTVSKHLQHAYEKLGVRSRRAVAMTLLR